MVTRQTPPLTMGCGNQEEGEYDPSIDIRYHKYKFRSLFHAEEIAGLLIDEQIKCLQAGISFQDEVSQVNFLSTRQVSLMSINVVDPTIVQVKESPSQQQVYYDTKYKRMIIPDATIQNSNSFSESQREVADIQLLTPVRKISVSLKIILPLILKEYPYLNKSDVMQICNYTAYTYGEDRQISSNMMMSMQQFLQLCYQCSAENFQQIAVSHQHMLFFHCDRNFNGVVKVDDMIAIYSQHFGEETAKRAEKVFKQHGKYMDVRDFAIDLNLDIPDIYVKIDAQKCIKHEIYRQRKEKEYMEQIDNQIEYVQKKQRIDTKDKKFLRRMTDEEMKHEIDRQIDEQGLFQIQESPSESQQ